MGRAVPIFAGDAAAYAERGLRLYRQGQLDDAIGAYREALVVRPDLAVVEINLGLALQDQGHEASALACFERAVALRPRWAEAHFALANALRDHGRTDGAIVHYRRALEYQPDHGAALNNLGLILRAEGTLDAAAECFAAAVAIHPEHAEAHNNLGLVWQACGQMERAESCYRRAVALAPQLADAHNNLGTVLAARGALDAAADAYHEALELVPDFAEAHNNIGNLLADRGLVEAAIVAYRRAISLQPENAAATAQLFYQSQLACDWAEVERLGPILDWQTDAAFTAGERPGETPFGSLARALPPARRGAIARAWAPETCRRMARPASPSAAVHDRRRTKRLVVGYLSADFGDHPVTHQIAGLLPRHDRERFEIVAYSRGTRADDQYSAKIAPACDRYWNLQGMAAADAARVIADDEVDILVDLMGYTSGNRLEIAALRPAPIQVSYLGFLGTTGSACIDYMITDPVATPPVLAPHYAEHFAYLPPSCLVLNQADLSPKGGDLTRAEAGLPEDALVFCSMNAPYKIEPVMFDLWLGLLRAVPESVLWLFGSNALASASLQDATAAQGIDPARLIFAAKLPYQDHLRRLRLADLALDTRLYNGGLTTANVLAAGVPVITLSGADFPARMSASMLSAIELPELITPDLDTYRALALHLAMTPEALQTVRAKLWIKRRTTALFDTTRFTQRLEHAFELMWYRHAAGQSPHPFEVAGARD